MVSDYDLETGGAKQERQDNTETPQWANTLPDRIDISYSPENESAGPKLFTQHEDLDTPEHGKPKTAVQTEIDQIQNPTSFYDEDGRILDPAHAVKVAYALKEEGMDKAILVEQALKREFDTGLTQEQEYNLKNLHEYQTDQKLKQFLRYLSRLVQILSVYKCSILHLGQQYLQLPMQLFHHQNYQL